jgi:signal transduction histidine kinase
VRLGPATLRLTLAVAAGIIVISLAAMVAQYRLTRATLEARQLALLQADLDAFAALYEQRRIPALRQALDYRAASTDPAEALFLLQDKARAPLAGNGATWPEAVPMPPEAADFSTAGLVRFTAQGTAYEGVARVLPGGFPLLVARGTGEVDATLAALRRMILLVALGLAVAALVAGFLTARLVLGRIDRLNRLADQVAAGDLAARLPGPRSADEFGALETHVHAMLDRIQALNRATHRLSDSIAHELRTPLNRILQRLTGDDDATEAIRAEVRGTIRIFDSLLDISAAEASSGSSAGVVPVDLSAVAAEVFELYEPVAEDKGLTAEARVEPGLWVLGDRNLIAQIASNLLDNAIKFTPAGGTVTLTLAGSERAVLTVADTGPGLPEGTAMFERFARGERDRGVRGHGLGLALVQAIATRHGARVSLPPVDRGLAVAVSFPQVAMPPPG